MHVSHLCVSPLSKGFYICRKYLFHFVGPVQNKNDHFTKYLALAASWNTAPIFLGSNLLSLNMLPSLVISMPKLKLLKTNPNYLPVYVRGGGGCHAQSATLKFIFDRSSSRDSANLVEDLLGEEQHI
jgi:hypothetical protein